MVLKLKLCCVLRSNLNVSQEKLCKIYLCNTYFKTYFIICQKTDAHDDLNTDITEDNQLEYVYKKIEKLLLMNVIEL